MRRCPASGRGTRSFAITRCGISRSTGRTPSGWCRTASASISTVSGTNSRPIRRISTRPLARHYAALYARPGAMHAGFEQFKAFDQDAARQQGLRRRRQAHHAGPGGRRREILRADHGGRDARGGDQRDRSHRSRIPVTGSWRKIRRPPSSSSPISSPNSRRHPYSRPHRFLCGAWLRPFPRPPFSSKDPPRGA